MSDKKLLHKTIESGFFKIIPNDCSIIIYGFGELGETIYHKLNKEKYNIIAIIDRILFNKVIDKHVIQKPCLIEKIPYHNKIIIINTILNYYESNKVDKYINQINVYWNIIKLNEYLKDNTIKYLMDLNQINGYLYQTGWQQSVKKGKPVTQHNEPLPWVTYPFIEFIRNRLTKNMNIFEYGCGNSTLWYAKKVKSVTSVEHNLKWYNKIRLQLPGNCSIFYQDLEYDGRYSKFSSSLNKKFDIIIVDGRDRVNCLKSSLNALASDGIIVLDNSERPSYKEGINYIKSYQFKELDFWGIAPGITFNMSTTIFYRKNNCLNL